MKIIQKYFTIWWIPLLSYFVPLIIFILGTVLKSDDIIDIALVLFLLNICGNIISAIVQIARKRWYYIFPQLIVSGILLFIVGLIFTFSPPDFYGANKTIPKNIKIDSPSEKELLEIDLRTENFQIAALSQGGIYTYYTNFQPSSLGVFYIKAFEITTNDRLSEKRMSNDSQVIVDNLDKNIYSGKFTIYEGSWGDNYAARIELWYRPKNGKEFKVAQKNYAIEGWMR